jgi:hypothetical protein
LRRHVVLHEILHGIMEHAGQGDMERQEEIVEMIAYGLEVTQIDGKTLLR